MAGKLNQYFLCTLDIAETSIADTSTEDFNLSTRSQKSPSPELQPDPSSQPVSISSSPETIEPSDEYEVTKAPADDSDSEKMEVNPIQHHQKNSNLVYKSINFSGGRTYACPSSRRTST